MSKDDESVIPDMIYDSTLRISYKRGEFLGRGGFAKCYELVNLATMKSSAGKIVSKKMMAKQNQKTKMIQEIQIHRVLVHKNIVSFNSFFEDVHNVYIVLELCKRRSMMELHKRRKALTEPETRYYMNHIINGVMYLHQNKIIHRDLKLGNLFLNDELVVKIGDFGLAAKLEHVDEKKKTLCGTPNYIAPEILKKEGHSFEVDIWSVGCIMYTLLVGKPPFETASLKETYARIKKCQYKMNGNISTNAKHMIMVMLQSNPSNRPKIEQLSKHDFITKGYHPTTLPVSCLTMAPRFDNISMGVGPSPNKRPLLEIQGKNGMDRLSPDPKRNSIAAGLMGIIPTSNYDTHFNPIENLKTLQRLLGGIIKCKPVLHKYVSAEMSDPAAQPTIWVSKWVDYSDKYGFGYQLSDESVGVMFNDTTRLIMLANSMNVQYVNKNGEESYMTVDNYPKPYEKKMKLLSYFSRYMSEHLIKTGAGVCKELDMMSRKPHLYQWCRSTTGVLMHLNCGILQINFGDHTKIIMCPLMESITFIDDEKSFRTFRFTTLEKHGCLAPLYEKIRYAFDKITLLLSGNDPASSEMMLQR